MTREEISQELDHLDREGLEELIANAIEHDLIALEKDNREPLLVKIVTPHQS